MALEYDGQRIGAMQYNGVTIGEAMIDGQVVYRSVIRVTPAAPTFHDGEPWITLPTVEGVTYSVSGTPGYNASVTVTATAQPGYELVGAASWSHTFGPPPRYVASGSGGGGRVNSSSWTTITSHTVSSDGVAGGTWTFEWSNYLSTARTAQTRVQRNGQTIASDVRTSGGNIVHNVNIPETQFNTGDTVTFQSHLDTSNSGQREYSSWSWSLS